ncbi:MAG: EpsG family protein [Bacteroidota bacterium]|nr:EpsG family protein [Bacteroidota bacterium]
MTNNTRWGIFLFTGMILVALATFKPIGMDNDSENYEIYFNQYDNPIFALSVERSFFLVSRFIHTFFGPEIRILFFIYALLGVSIKFYSLQKLTPFISLSIAIYISNFYILHEFTQIRAGISAGILLLMLPSLAHRKYWQTIGLVAIAMVFHYSSLLLIPLLLLSNSDLSKRQRLIWASLIPIGYIIHFLNISITSIPIPYFSDKLETYQTMKENGMLDNINVFNLVYLVKNAIFIYLLVMYDTIKEHCPYFNIMLKIMALSLMSFTAFSFLPVFAFRASELFGVIEIVLFTYIFFTIKPAWLAKTTVITISLALFAINVFYNDILKLM